VPQKAVDIQAVDDVGRRDSRPVPDKPLWIIMTENVVRSGPGVLSCVGDDRNAKNGFCHRGVIVALVRCDIIWFCIRATIIRCRVKPAVL
jgi:hypothetical protein